MLYIKSSSPKSIKNHIGMQDFYIITIEISFCIEYDISTSGHLSNNVYMIPCFQHSYIYIRFTAWFYRWFIGIVFHVKKELSSSTITSFLCYRYIWNMEMHIDMWFYLRYIYPIVIINHYIVVDAWWYFPFFPCPYDF